MILPLESNSSRTLLHAAADTLSPDAFLETVKELVAAGLDPIQADADQWAQLHYA
jgi:ankyrin repeat protein